MKIAGCMHDIGNAINRTHHAELGALLANDILKDGGMNIADRMVVFVSLEVRAEKTAIITNIIVPIAEA